MGRLPYSLDLNWPSFDPVIERIPPSAQPRPSLLASVDFALHATMLDA